MKLNYDWPKKEITWIKDRTLFVSIPFTWNLPRVRSMLLQRSLFWDKAIVGGPAVSLAFHNLEISEIFSDMDFVQIGQWNLSGVLQRVNPMATKTTMGCIRDCSFCAVPHIESIYFKNGFKELDDWPDLPILIDNNLLAASKKHFGKVIDRLKRHGWADFNQGLDARLLTKYHAERIAEIKKPLVRLSLDSMEYVEKWESALEKLRNAGLPKRSIRSYVLIGFDTGIQDAWDRCENVNSFGIKALPQWFHNLDALEHNIVTEDQKSLGWTDEERKLIMQYYYQKGGRRNIDERILKKKYSS